MDNQWNIVTKENFLLVCLNLECNRTTQVNHYSKISSSATLNSLPLSGENTTVTLCDIDKVRAICFPILIQVGSMTFRIFNYLLNLKNSVQCILKLGTSEAGSEKPLSSGAQVFTCELSLTSTNQL